MIASYQNYYVQIHLKFLLFNLQPSAHLLEFVNRAASFSKLIRQILDFNAHVLVFASQTFAGLVHLVLGVLKLETFRRQSSVVPLYCIQFCRNVVALLAPFINELVEILLFLLQ